MFIIQSYISPKFQHEYKTPIFSPAPSERSPIVCDLPKEHEYAGTRNILVKREFQVLNLQRPFMSSTLMLKFTDIIRNLSFDDSQSSANRAIIPKNIITNNSMNFTSSASLIWTRYIHIHIFNLFL
jgi:hypothetical protein